MIIFEFLAVFVLILILSLGVSLFALPVAYLFKHIVPSTRPLSTRCIAGWKTKRGLVIRLVWVPFGITLALFVFTTVFDNYTLKQHIVESSRLVVRTGGNCHRKPAQERILYETTDRRSIQILAKQITLAFCMEGVSCKCCGDITFNFYDDQKLVCSFSLHHGRSIRIENVARNNKPLSWKSRRKLAEWLSQTGITAALARTGEEVEQPKPLAPPNNK